MRLERWPVRHPPAWLAGAALCALGACSHNADSIRPFVPEGSHPALKSNETAADKARPFIQLGQKYMEMGKLDIAKENLTKALVYDPKSVDAHTVLATLYDRVGDHESAEQHYRDAAALAPKAGRTNNNYGLYLCKVGKFAESRKYFDIALADGFYADKATVYTNAGTCQLLGKGSLDEAEADFRRAVEIDPNNPQALFQLANVFYQKNDFFKARAFIQRYDALGQPSPDALLLARNIETQLGHADAAHDYAQRLRDQFPNSEQAHTLESVSPSSTMP
jgi:type IV pilus assembly protein PilF